MSDAPAMNSDEARTPTGEIKDQQAPPETTTEASQESKKTEQTEAGKEQPKTGAPEAYVDFTAPEGFEVNKESLADVLPVFKELNLSQEQAQKLVDIYAQKVGSALKEPESYYEKVRTDWRKEIVNDPTLGNGTELRDEVKATIGRAIESLGAKEAAAFREAMDFTGAGDNPAFVRALYTLAKRATEGRPVNGSGPSIAGQRAPGDSRVSPAKALFPNLPSSGA